MKYNSKPSSSKISLEWASSYLDEFRRARSVIVEQPRIRLGDSEKRWVKTVPPGC